MSDRIGSVSATSEEPRSEGRGGMVLRLARRSRDNLVRPLRILSRRRLSRPARFWPLDWIGWAWLGIAVVAVAAAVLDPPVGAFDKSWPLPLRVAAARLTNVGLGVWYIAPAALVLLAVNLTDWQRLSRRGLLVAYNWCGLAMFVLLSTGLSGLIATIFKRIIGRARPMHFQDLGPFSFDPFGNASFASFPSGHAVILGSVATVVALLAPRLRYVAIPAALAVAATRVVVGAHYPSDVLGGLAFGCGFTMMVAAAFAQLGYVFRRNAHGRLVRKRSFRVFW